MAALAGRREELATLRACLDATRDGTAQVALIEGVAGIGKTRLLDEVLHAARRGPFTVIEARAEELEAARPFGALVPALAETAAVAPEIAGLVAAAAGDVTGGGGSTFHVRDRLLDHLEQLATSGPLVLAVDDLQWADPATLQTVVALLDRSASLPLAIVLTLRPVPRSRSLDRVLEAVFAAAPTHVRLGPLSPEAVGSLLAEVVAAEPGDSLRNQMERAGGNPFYLHELLGSLAVDGAIEVRDGRAEVVSDVFPATLGSTVLRHLRFLQPSTLELLEAAAVLGTTFAAADLAILSSRSADELVRPLREGIDAGVLLERGDSFAFRHDLVREALYHRLPRGLRRQLHLQVGRALAGVGGAAPRAATHLAIGAEPGDPEAVALLRRAAIELAMTAPDIAEGFARRAIELAEPGEPLHDELRADLVTLLVASGRPTEAREQALEVLASAHDEGVDGRLRFALGQACFLLGELDAAIEQMRQAAAHVPLGPAARSLALAEVAMVQLLASGDLNGAEADAQAALEAARDADDPISESMALCVLAGVAQFRGHLRQARQVVEQAIDLGTQEVADEPGALTSALRDPHMFHGMVLLDVDEFDEAVVAFRAGAKVSLERGVAGGGHFYHYWLGYRHYLAGTWDDAVAELETGLALADGIENRRGVLAAHALLGLIAIHRDDLVAASTHITASEQQFAADGPDLGADWMLQGRALLLEADGDVTGACGLLAAVWNALDGLGSRIQVRTLAVDLTRLALAAGDRDTATMATRAAEQFAAEEPVTSVVGMAVHCRGLLDEDPGALREAVRVLRAGPRPLPLANVEEDTAAVVVQDPERLEEGRALFEAAQARYAALGADRDTRRLLARLRAAGLRAGVRQPRQRPATGWASLTPTELRVVELVAQGLSNPQIGERLFVSRRTIQTHVSNVFRKLSLSSRAELAAAATRRDGQ